jgi:hypothetical protein
MDETGEGEFGTVACRLLLRLDPLFHFRHASYIFGFIHQSTCIFSQEDLS